MLPTDATFQAGVQLAIDALYERGIDVNRRILSHEDASAALLAIQLLRIVARGGLEAIGQRGDNPDAHIAEIVRRAAQQWTV